MTKRQRFVLTSILLSLGFVGVQFLPDQYRLLGIGVLGLLTLILFGWSIKEGISFDHTLATLILPPLFTVGVGLFWFLLPSSIYARIPVVLLYGVGIYALSLTANIYTVAAIRTIALLRAARGVGFVLTLVTFFLIFDAILSLRASILLTSLLASLSSLLLFYQGYWSVVLDKSFSKEIFSTAVISSFVIGEIAMSLYFWPVTVVVGSLFLTVACYVLLGLGQSRLEGRLFQQTIREYLLVGVLVFIGMFFATHWGA
jgi:hypothetical protein